jgi:hypothetical protein
MAGSLQKEQFIPPNWQPLPRTFSQAITKETKSIFKAV